MPLAINFVAYFAKKIFGIIWHIFYILNKSGIIWQNSKKSLFKAGHF